jgi:hypothetical protein
MSTDKETDLDVSTFDAAFATNPDKDEWRQFGDEARETFDATDTGVNAISLSSRLLNLMIKQKQRMGDKYARAKFVELADLALTLCDVPSGITANQLIPLVWIVKLDKSIPGEPGKPRSWAGSISDPSWYGGKLSMGTLRVLASKLRRVSGKSETDEWDYKEGWESYVREYVKSLRAGTLSLNSLKRLIDQREAELQTEADRASNAGKTPEQIAAAKEADAIAQHDAKIQKLGSDLLTAYSTAVKDLKMDKDEFTKLLRDKKILAQPSAKITPAEIAKSMTPGDAVALVQALCGQMTSEPQRTLIVLRALAKSASDAVKQIKTANTAAPTVPLKATG